MMGQATEDTGDLVPGGGAGSLNLAASLQLALSPIALVHGNVIPLVGVMAWGWDAAAVVIFYWSENLIIGGLTLLKMLYKSPIGGLFSGLFFTVHYGGFCAVHGFLAMGLFGLDDGAVMPSLGWPFFFVFIELLVSVVRQVVNLSPPEWIWGFAGLAASHSVSFLTNFLWRGEHRNQTLHRLMTARYGRIIVLHLAIVFGGWGVLALGSPLPILMILIILKTSLDLRLHLREHGLTFEFWRRRQGLLADA